MMIKKIYLAFLIILFVLSFVALVRLSPRNSNNEIPNELGKTSTGNVVSSGGDSSSEGTSSNIISSSELSKHNSESDCWVSYDGKVYDITDFLPVHPGGKDRIMPYCGTSDEFQNAFRKEHGTSKVKVLMSVGALMGDFEVKGKVN